MSSQAAALRFLTLLNCIPSYPRKVSTEVLRQKLLERGFEVSERMLQRDLNEKLLSSFPIQCDDSAKPYRYGFMQGAHNGYSTMESETALAFNLAKEYLERLMPQSAMSLLNNKFSQAQSTLQTMPENTLATWQSRVRVLPSGVNLKPADVSFKVWCDISDALLGGQQVKVTYNSPKNNGASSQWVIHPQGLVSKHHVSYLVVRINDYQNFMILALHRIIESELMDDKASLCSVSELNDYIDSGELGWGEGEGHVELVAEISPYTASVLQETPLAADQLIMPISNGLGYSLKARVPKNKETLWWIMGLNKNIKVIEPLEWVEEIKSLLKEQVEMYE